MQRKMLIIRNTIEEMKESMATGKALDGKPYAGNPHVAPSQRYMHRRGEASEGTLPKATRSYDPTAGRFA